MPFSRHRFHYFILIGLTITAGLLSRTALTPQWIYPYLGDILYAVMIYFILAFLLPKTSILRITLLTIAICFAIEISQLINNEWLNAIRDQRLGGLILGHGFLKSDLVCLFLGAVIGGGGEYFWYERKTL